MPVIKFCSRSSALADAAIRLVVLWLFGNVLLFAAESYAAPILFYQTTALQALLANESRDGQLSWAVYDESVCDHGRVSVLSESSSVTTFDVLELRTPFFSAENVVWYASSFGFLSVVNSPMCEFFCHDHSEQSSTGEYRAISLDRAGDWPTASLFAAALYPWISPDARVCVSKVVAADAGHENQDDAILQQTIEYNSIPVAAASVAANNSTRLLTAQTTFYSNGTIVFRYLRIPSIPSENTANVVLPSYASLKLSDAEYVNVPLPTEETVPWAIRFDPVFDRCFTAPSSACVSIDCLRNQCFTNNECAWCEATEECFHLSTAAARCPSLQALRTPVTADNGEASASGEVKMSTQKFYTVEVAHGNATFLEELPDSTTSYDYLTFRSDVTIPLGFTFPFFTRRRTPPTRSSELAVASHNESYGQEQVRHTSQVHLDHTGTISVLQNNQSCTHYLNYCWDRDYAFAIVPFQTKASWKRWGSSVKYFTLPARNTSDFLCDESIGRGTTCPAAAVIQVRGIKPVTGAFSDVFEYGQEYAFQLYMDEEGTIEIVYDREGSWTGVQEHISASSSALRGDGDAPDFYVSQPDGVVGLVYSRVDDARSVLVPPRLVRAGTRVRFQLASNCADCGELGACNETSGECVCDIGFNASTKCRECERGYYGPQCLPCKECVNGGVCSESAAGDGKCVCPEGYLGEFCHETCASLWQSLGLVKDPTVDWETVTHCPSVGRCSGEGGRCLCGLCMCRPGWAGAACDVELIDPCWGYTLNGCESCVTRPGCGFCPDNELCMSVGRSGHTAASTCAMPLMTSENMDYGMCSGVGPYQANGEVSNGEREVLLLYAGFGILFSLAGIFFLVSIFVILGNLSRDADFYRRAPGGLRRLPPAPRDREIHTYIPWDKVLTGVRFDAVAGIPVKQISLVALCKRQRRNHTEPNTATKGD